MSDFDEVLERLLVDPSFQSALSADAGTALAGYQLTPQERQLLGAPVVAGPGEDHTVELRTSKSGMIGLLGPVAAAFGVAATGSAPAQQSLGGGPTQTFGGGPAQTIGGGPAAQTFGDAAPAGATPGGQSFGLLPQSDGSGPSQTFGPSGTESFGAGAATESFGSTDGAGAGTFGSAPIEAVDYHTQVDADGDGRWDAYTAYERPDGGVDIAVDANHDGRVDFVGHDVNRDGLVDSADYDNDRDGVFETRMYDDNGDGWLDRSEPIPGGEGGPVGQAAPVPAPTEQTWGEVPGH